MAEKPNNIETPTCMVTGCARSARSRGLCDMHYTYIAMKVKKGELNWEKLVEAGVCLDRKNKRSDTGIGVAAFLKEKGVKYGN